jgi:hypothetical protein
VDPPNSAAFWNHFHDDETMLDRFQGPKNMLFIFVAAADYRFTCLVV